MSKEVVERGTLTVVEAAARLGISRGTAYQMAATGDLPVLRCGRRMVVPKAALERMLAGAVVMTAAG